MKNIQKYLTGKIIASIFFIILGIIMIAKPLQVVSLITMILGIGTIIMGVVLIGLDVISKELFLRSGTLMQGVLLIVMGIALLAYPNIGNILLPLSIGAIIIADSILRLQIGRAITHIGGTSYLTIISILTFILGLICVFNPMISSQVITIYLAIMMIVEAITSLVDTIYVKKYMKELQDNIIDV